jgi:hypothetical protein
LQDLAVEMLDEKDYSTLLFMPEAS